MAILYKPVAMAIALRSNQISDAVTAAALETIYAGTLASALAGLEIPLTALKQTILASEKRIASVCGRQKNPILHGDMMSKTANIANKGAIPKKDASNKHFIGNFLGCYDAATDYPLTEKTKQEVLRRLNNPGTFFKLDTNIFCIEVDMLIHTVTNAYLKGCVWDRATQETAWGNIETTGASPLAQELETWLVAESLAMSAQEEWFHGEASIFRTVAAQCEQDVRGGVIPTAILPGTTAGAEPVKD